MRITDSIRRQIIQKTVETYFPDDIRTNFIENIRQVWCNYVYGLYPDIPKDRFIEVGLELYDKDTNLDIILWRCPYININQCVTLVGGRNNMCNVDISTCPVPHIREIVNMYQDWEKKRGRFSLLLDTELTSIYCDKTFIERLPYLKSALAPFMPEFDNELAVAVDLDQIAEDNIVLAG